VVHDLLDAAQGLDAGRISTPRFDIAVHAWPRGRQDREPQAPSRSIQCSQLSRVIHSPWMKTIVLASDIGETALGLPVRQPRRWPGAGLR